MILTFDQAGELLDEMAEEFPPEFYQDLNGGVCLLPEAKPTRSSPRARCISWGSTATI